MIKENYYTIEEVSNTLKVAYLTVYRWIKSGKLKAYQVGRLYRITEANLKTFVESKK